jgi:hypothetical protein
MDMAKRIGARPRIERISVVVGAILSSFVGLQTAWGQDSDSVTVDVGKCVDLESPEERFACYEAEVAATVQEQGAAPATAEGRPADGVPPPAASTGRSVEEADHAPAAQDGEAVENASPDGGDTTTRRRRGQSVREFVATVTALRETVPNSFTITLDNGQVWRQRQPKWYPLRPGQEVRIYSTNWGSAFRLEALDVNGFIQVELVR